MKPLVYPVIHHLDSETTFDQAHLAAEAGADGVFLISHNGRDSELLSNAIELKGHFPKTFKIGLNFLSGNPIFRFLECHKYHIDMFWADYLGITSKGLNEDGIPFLMELPDNRNTEIFASVAFKYQHHEFDPAKAAKNCRLLNFIPTTSGTATGVPPSADKIKNMWNGYSLAVASGMTVDNIETYAPYLSHILVSTGVSLDGHHFDYELLRIFISKAKK